MTTTQVLQKKSLVLIFTYAPAGLGHLRVTDALYSGLPTDTQTHLLGSHDTNVKLLHRVFSIHPLLRRVFEWLQYNPQQYFWSWFYTSFTRSQAKMMHEQLTTILDQRLETPQTVLIVATHFALGHQVGVVKEKIEKERKVKIILAVQVTDDSPQFMWYVPEADVIFVPSVSTKKELEAYGKQVNFPPVNFVVNAYPVSPKLSQRLNPVEYHEKSHQIDPRSKSQIHISIPVSGAAVGLDYAKELIDELYKNTHQFIFHVTTRSAAYTLPFLNEMIQRPYVKLYVSSEDRDVVNAYEHVYSKYLVSLEISKPSEQAFKTLLLPQHRGGCIMLLSDPVGRQEYDNIDFMRRHNLIPSPTQQEQLWKLAKEQKPPTKALLESAKLWRGLMLPVQSKEAGAYIWWCLQNGIFVQMMDYQQPKDRTPAEALEVSPFGVAEFWDKVSDFLSRKDKPSASQQAS